MKKLVIALALVTATVQAYECPTFSLNQTKVLQYSYSRGIEHGLANVLASIAWTESTAGQVMISNWTSDYGVYQGNVKTICSQAGVLDERHLCNMELTRVVLDNEIAADHAIETLQWWLKYHKGNLQRAIRSYNAGFDFNSKQADAYWKKFTASSKMIKNCTYFD